ncbi:hypothetical protein QOT17_024256 [Balamuthia mandrillaris]
MVMSDNKRLTVKELRQRIEDLGGQWTTKDSKSVLLHKLQMQTPTSNPSSNQPLDLSETDEGSSSSPSNRNDWILRKSDLEAVRLFCALDGTDEKTKEVAELCKTRLQEGTRLVLLKAITMKAQISPSAHLLRWMAQFSPSNPLKGKSLAAPYNAAQPFKSSVRVMIALYGADHNCCLNFLFGCAANTLYSQQSEEDNRFRIWNVDNGDEEQVRKLIIEECTTKLLSSGKKCNRAQEMEHCKQSCKRVWRLWAARASWKYGSSSAFYQSLECGVALRANKLLITTTTTFYSWHRPLKPEGLNKLLAIFNSGGILSFDEHSSLLLMELPSALWVHPKSNQQEYVCLGGNHRCAAAHVLYCENSPKLKKLTWRAKVLPFDGKQLPSVAVLDETSSKHQAKKAKNHHRGRPKLNTSPQPSKQLAHQLNKWGKDVLASHSPPTKFKVIIYDNLPTHAPLMLDSLGVHCQNHHVERVLLITTHYNHLHLAMNQINAYKQKQCQLLINLKLEIVLVFGYKPHHSNHNNKPQWCENGIFVAVWNKGQTQLQDNSSSITSSLLALETWQPTSVVIPIKGPQAQEGQVADQANLSSSPVPSLNMYRYLLNTFTEPKDVVLAFNPTSGLFAGRPVRILKENERESREVGYAKGENNRRSVKDTSAAW